MLQTLNILENFDLKSMGYNSTRYIHTLYQAMSLLLLTAILLWRSLFPAGRTDQWIAIKEYAKQRAALIKYDATIQTLAPVIPIRLK